MEAVETKTDRLNFINLSKKNKELTFMDFCAGIGGGRLGLEKNKLKCLAYSEIDHAPETTYKTIFGYSEKGFGDITKIDTKELPEFDVMIAGFPCQTFSVVGKRQGFEDARGQIIYSLINILKEKNVPYFIFENVKGLVNHDRGRTLKIILEELDKAGYKVKWKILNSIDYGVPQMRERIYLVGMKKTVTFKATSFKWPEEKTRVDLKQFLVGYNNKELDPNTDQTFIKYFNNKYNVGKFNLEEILNEDYLVLDTRQSDLRLYRDKVPTLRTGRHGILYVKDHKLLKLSGYESLLLQGFSRDYAKKASDNITESKLLSQAGNAMTVSTITAIGKSLKTYINY